MHKATPIIIKKLQALSARVRKVNPAIEKELAIRSAGNYGEHSLNYYLQFINRRWWTTSGVRLDGDNHYFQMDYLLISQSRIIIVEVKNMDGKLEYDHRTHQLIQKLNSDEHI